MNQTFHFNTYEPAIHFHLSKRLIQKGWHITPTSRFARFSDDNLTLDDSISIVLEYKHLLAWLHQWFFKQHMLDTFPINDETYPEVLTRLKHHPMSNRPWILKPSLLNNGDYIHVFESIEGIVRHYGTPRRLGGDHVIQKYLENPHLWEGRKYTFRMPVILSNYAGVFMYEHGYINISSLPYTSSIEPLVRKKHLTNYILDGTLAGITQRSTHDVPNFEVIRDKFSKIVHDVVKGLLAVFPKYLTMTEKPIFEIFGFDFILDDTLKPWLLEINQGPDFPLVEQHPLYQTLWDPFWNKIIEEFVEPMAARELKYNPDSFIKILAQKGASKVSLLSRFKGKRFYKHYKPYLVMQ